MAEHDVNMIGLTLQQHAPHALAEYLRDTTATVILQVDERSMSVVAANRAFVSLASPSESPIGKHVSKYIPELDALRQYLAEGSTCARMMLTLRCADGVDRASCVDIHAIPGGMILLAEATSNPSDALIAEMSEINQDMGNVTRELRKRNVELQKTHKSLAAANASLQGEIAERKRVEESLRESETRFMSVLYASDDAILLIGDNTFVDCSEATARMLGYATRAEFLQIHPSRLSPPEQPDGRNSFEKAEEMMRLAIQQGFNRFEWMHRRANGEDFPVEVSLTPIVLEGKDLLYCVWRDITEIRRMEQTLRESKARFDQLAEQSRTVAWEVDAQGLYTYVSHVSESVLGYRPDELVGRLHFYDLHPESGREAFKAAAFAVFERKEPFQDLVNAAQARDGRVMWLSTNGIPLLNKDGTLRGYRGSDTDITERRQAKDALRESETRMRAITDSAQDAILMMDPEGRVSYWNPAAQRILGYTHDEAIGQSLHNFIAPERYRAVHHAAFPEFQRSGRGSAVGQTLELHARRKDGQEITVSLSLSAVQFGNAWHAIGIMRDITEQKQAQEALRRSETKFRTLYESTSDAVMLFNERGFFDCNKAALTMFGCNTREEFCSKHPADLSPVKQPCGTDSMALANERVAVVITTGSNCFEWVHKRCDTGATFPAEVLLNAMELDGTTVLQAVVRDITERKRAEEKLHQFSRAVEQNPASIVITNPRGEIEYVNAKFIALTGYTRAEVLAQNPRMLKSGDKDPAAYRDLWETITAGKEWRGEFRNKKKNGELYWESASISPIRDRSGHVTHFLAIKEDISDRKRMEETLRETNRQLEKATAQANSMASQAEMANAAKSEFLANMSHEIRTPMNGVIGMAGLLLDTELAEDQRRYAETVRSSAEALLTIINDILDFSKIEAGKLELETLNFDLRAVLDDFAALLALRASEKNLEFVCAAAPDVPAMLCGDPGRLRQVLTNLAGNAVKFTHQGEVAVRAALVSETDAEAVIRFSVKDTGIGIPADKQGLLFQKFAQVDASTARKYGGTGLGLAISKQLAELMGGQVGVNSEEGQGSEFWFTARLAKQPVAAGADSHKPSLSNFRGARVLVVDDNRTNREVLLAQLRAWGAQAAEAPDGVSALRVLRDASEQGTPFQLAILDGQMPGMDGESLAKAVRADDRLSRIPLVMMTSMGRRSDTARLQEIGFAAYLTKPVRQSDLLGCLAVALTGQNQLPVVHPTVTPHPARETRFDGARVLVAEDNIINQQVAKGILTKLGLRVDTVANGAEAVNALESIPYDLVFMDVQMPEMNGYEATRAIRDPRSSVLDHRVPIIAMTANTMQGDREECLEVGMDDYISKPISPDAVRAALAKWLAKDGADSGETLLTGADAAFAASVSQAEPAVVPVVG